MQQTSTLHTGSVYPSLGRFHIFGFLPPVTFQKKVYYSSPVIIKGEVFSLSHLFNLVVPGFSRKMVNQHTHVVQLCHDSKT